jgi:hypothetical protein
MGTCLQVKEYKETLEHYVEVLSYYIILKTHQNAWI